MSDYMFMLENHLTSGQSRVVAEVQAAAAEVNLNLFLTGGAVRDMLGGFQVRDLDFTVEGNPIKLAKTIAHRANATIVSTDDNRKAVEMIFPGNVTAEIGMARLEKYVKPGGKPHVTPATIHEDLRSRDFTINGLALSLNRASRGLLIDPTNGMGDLERRELRAVSNYTLYDSPIRLFRLLRFKVRLGFSISERTQLQYENAREAAVEKYITPQSLLAELQYVAAEPTVGDILHAWDEAKLLSLVSPALTGPKLNLQSFVKLQKTRQLIPFGVDLPTDNTALFFNLLTEKLTPKERTALIAHLGMDKEAAANWQKLDLRAAKLEKELTSAKVRKPSHIYFTLAKAPGEQALLLSVRSTHRATQERTKTYFGKLLAVAEEVTDLQVIEAGGVMGSPKFAKMKTEMIAKRLDARPPKPPVEEVAPEPPPPPPSVHGRRAPQIS